MSPVIRLVVTLMTIGNLLCVLITVAFSSEFGVSVDDKTGLPR